jgi:hypothetical protein
VTWIKLNLTNAIWVGKGEWPDPAQWHHREWKSQIIFKHLAASLQHGKKKPGKSPAFPINR